MTVDGCFAKTHSFGDCIDGYRFHSLIGDQPSSGLYDLLFAYGSGLTYQDNTANLSK